MPVSTGTFLRVKKLHTDSLEAVINESFETVTRMCYALTGQDRAGGMVITKIVKRGMSAAHKWRDAEESQRWFLHHTIIECRLHPHDGEREDLLIEQSSESTPAYHAFVRGLRALPQQQVEAFLLHHGEAFNLRFLAVAMDCSVKAAEQHLAAATTHMRSLCGERFDQLTATLRQAYLSLTPAGKVQLPHVKRLIRRHVWPRRLWRGTQFVLSLALIAAIAWFCYEILPSIEY